MSRHTFKVVQVLPIALKQAWNFFSNPANLQFITPGNFQFRILTNIENRPIYPGQIIHYTVRPLFNIQIRWTTIITKVKEEGMFIDEQQSGPFRYWEHQHFFKSIEGKTEMTDIVTYEVPGWFAGELINKLLIKTQLKNLFHYRYSAIESFDYASFDCAQDSDSRKLAPFRENSR